MDGRYDLEGGRWLRQKPRFPKQTKAASVLFARRFPHRISGSPPGASSRRPGRRRSRSPAADRLGVRGPPPLQTREFCQHGAGAPGVDIGTRRHAKAGETRIPGDVAWRDKEISLLYRLRQPDCRRPSWCRHSGTPSPFVVKLTVTESSACICKKSLTESISDSNLSASAPLRPNAAPAGEMRFGICGGQSPAEKAE